MVVLLVVAVAVVLVVVVVVAVVVVVVVGSTRRGGVEKLAAHSLSRVNPNDVTRTLSQTKELGRRASQPRYAARFLQPGLTLLPYHCLLYRCFSGSYSPAWYYCVSALRGVMSVGFGLTREIE